MNPRSKIIILVICGFFLAILSINSTNSLRTDNLNSGMRVEHDNNTILKIPKQSGYWNNFSFIHIDGNWSTAASYEWCSGDGSWGNPYTLENITIDASSSPTGSGIFINNSKNDYFIIKNCTVYNAGASFDGGIKLENTNNGTLINNNCSKNQMWGILLNSNCYNNTISGNIANHNEEGIYIRIGSDNNTISGNTATNNSGWAGIALNSDCYYNNISGNNASNNHYYGIYLYDNCSNNTISGNSANNNTENGIRLETSCDNNTISGNNITGNDHGIYIQDCGGDTIYCNSIENSDNEGIELTDNCYYNTLIGNALTNNSITDGGENNVLAMNCVNDIYSSLSIDNANGPWGTFTWEEVVQYVPWIGGNGSRSDPYVIEDLFIYAGNPGTGISIDNSKNDYFIINNCTVRGDSNSIGIQMHNSNNGTLTNNNCSSIGYEMVYGIDLGNGCVNNTITGNTVNTNSMSGISLGFYCDNNTISGNTAKYSGTGIGLNYFCINNTISGNTVNDNQGYGILLNYWCHNNTISGNNVSNIETGNQDNGIFLQNHCHNNTITGNNACYNTQNGIILMENCSFNTISGNKATNNGQDGIILTHIGNPCNNNTITGNNFSYNTQHGIHFYGYNNQYNTIADNTISYNIDIGIHFSDAGNNNKFIGNNISYNGGQGIYLIGTYNMVLGNIIHNNSGDGIAGGLFCTISGNNISNNIGNGIYSTGNNFTISENNISNNTGPGMLILSTCNYTISGNNISNNQIGIWIALSNENIFILENNVNNNLIGIHMDYSSSSRIIGNILSNNTQYGVLLDGSYHLLYNNRFINNTVHARHNGENFWNSSVIGNYWDNYTGFDVDRDGIGDIPYSIPGIIDYLPIWTISNSNVSIDLPINNTLWATPPLLKIRTFHPSNHSNWYNVSGNPNIAFFQNNTQFNLDISLWNSLLESQFKISFYFNDTSGDIYETVTYTLYKDSQAPEMAFSFPSDGEYFSAAPPTYNIEVSDQYPFTMWYSFNNLLNITFTTNGTMDFGNWTALPDGPIILRFYAKDTIGNLQTSTINIIKDTTKPSITISAPKELQVFVNEVPEFDITVKDASPCKIWYSLNDGKNISCSESSKIKAKEWNAISDGVVRITFYVQDEAGNLDSIEIDVQKTTINWPLIIIIIVAAAIAMVGVGLFARRSRIKTKVRDAKIVDFLDQQKSAITENDISIYKEQHICLVHKGKIDGISYICPNCGSFYCMKCYDALIELENQCWSCRSSIDASKPVKAFDKYKSSIDDKKGKKVVPEPIKEVRETPKSVDDAIEKKGLLKSTEMKRKADLKRASLMKATSLELKKPIKKKTPLESQTEINELKQYIDYANKKLDDINIEVKIGYITEKEYLKKKELLETILNSLNYKLDQIKK